MAKNINGLDTKQVATLDRVLGKTSSDHDQKCYNLLTQLLNREPSDTEIGNMMTDTGLQMRVLTYQI